MSSELESIRNSLAAGGALDDETKEALTTLETALSQIGENSLSERVQDVVSQTAVALGQDSTPSGSEISGKWEELRAAFADWEEQHPGVVMAISRLSNSLAAFGL